jgi:hypothetical protein
MLNVPVPGIRYREISHDQPRLLNCTSPGWVSSPHRGIQKEDPTCRRVLHLHRILKYQFLYIANRYQRDASQTQVTSFMHVLE